MQISQICCTANETTVTTSSLNHPTPTKIKYPTTATKRLTPPYRTFYHSFL